MSDPFDNDGDTNDPNADDLSPETAALLDSAIAEPAQSSGGQIAGPVTSDPREYLRNRLIQQVLDSTNVRASESSSDGKSSLASAAPAWYKPEAPPKGPGPVLGNLAQLAGSRSQKIADLAANEPLKSYGQKVQSQRRANQAALLGNMLGALGNRRMNAYQQDQDAALKQAQMQRTLREGSQNQSSIALGGLNYLLNEDRFKRQTDLDKQKAELEKRKNDPSSQESKDAQEAALASHILTPEQASGMSAYQIEKYRTALMDEQNRVNRAEEKDRSLYNTDVYARGKENREQEQHVAADQRKEQQRQAEYAPPSGYVWGGGHPPDPETARKGREFIAATDLVQSGAQRLKEIQHQLEQSGGIVPGALGGYTLTQATVLTPEQKQLTQEARQIQRDMVNAYRAQANYGALTGREQEYANEMNQAAGSPQGYFVGDAGWDALITESQRQRDINAPQRFNLYPPNKAPKGSSPIDRPPSEQIQRVPVPPLKGFRGQPAGPGPEEVAPQAASAPQQPSNVIGWFSVKTKAGDSSPMPMTEQQYKVIVQKYGADAVTRMK